MRKKTHPTTPRKPSYAEGIGKERSAHAKSGNASHAQSRGQTKIGWQQGSEVGRVGMCAWGCCLPMRPSHASASIAYSPRPSRKDANAASTERHAQLRQRHSRAHGRPDASQRSVAWWYGLRIGTEMIDQCVQIEIAIGEPREKALAWGASIVGVSRPIRRTGGGGGVGCGA